MAWENAINPFSGYNVAVLNAHGFETLENNGSLTPLDFDNNTGTDITVPTDGSVYHVFDGDSLTIDFYYTASITQLRIDIWYQNNGTWELMGNNTISTSQPFKLFMCRKTDNNTVVVGAINNYYYQVIQVKSDVWYSYLSSYFTSYNWHSVPSISGKNGILSLVTLDSESINDGEPVSGAAVSVFDQNPVSGNNVKDIVDGNTPLIPSAVDATAAFIISNPPVGELASRILAAKKGSIPESIEDADKTVSIPANASNVTMPGLDENSQYYFAIFVADATGDTAVSDPKDIYTSADEGWSFDYTGEIQTFVAPKTGIYQLETWGAQGGDATDGTLTARGGYGAYAVGEVLLNEGDTLYINVGGQNGYGGGGNYTPPNE